MRRNLWLWAVAAVLIAAPAEANTYFGFQIGIQSAPPPPRIYFRQEPDVVLVSETQVYVVENDGPYGVDMFRYGGFWFVTRDGYWYRSRSYRGPFRVVDARVVPRPIFYVPASHWRHHPRGGWPERRDRDRDRDRGWDEGRRHSRG